MRREQRHSPPSGGKHRVCNGLLDRRLVGPRVGLRHIVRHAQERRARVVERRPEQELFRLAEARALHYVIERSSGAQGGTGHYHGLFLGKEHLVQHGADVKRGVTQGEVGRLAAASHPVYAVFQRLRDELPEHPPEV